MEYSDIDTSDEREEGEIRDDDLEEISDASIAPSPKSGKLNSPEENLRAISLSSVSDLEVLDCSAYSSERKVYKRRESRKRKKFLKHHRRRSSGSSSENEEMVKTKKLLKEAINRDHQEDMHNNSLRTRLKKMVQNVFLPQEHELTSLNDCDNVQDNIESFETATISNGVETEEINREPIEADASPNPILGVDVDNELIQLRLEALKTAVINKFQRKKRKIKLDSQEDSKTLEVNKENSSDNCNAQSSILVNDQGTLEQVQSLANPSSPNSAINSEDEVDEDILRAVLLASMAKKITNKVSTPQKKAQQCNKPNIPSKKQLKTSHVVKSNIDLPKIEPIIISINNPDSDSDDVFNDTACSEDIKKENMTDKDQIEQRIDNFLKQQRAEVEAKAISASVPKPAASINSHEKKNVQLNSLYKLLPKNKQVEYVKLVQKLNSANKKPRLKRLSCRTSDNKLQKSKVSVKTTENNSTNSRSSLSGTQQKQLRHVQLELNGRLQEKGKYVELSPLLKKMEQVNVEQKKHEVRISQLLKQLSDARLKSSKLQSVFNDLMQDFVKKKKEIDSNTKDAHPPKQVVKPLPRITVSNPKKNITSQKPTEKISPKKPSLAIHKNSVQCKVVLEKCPANLEDPNDIEFKMLGKVDTNEIPKYSSPLDYMGSKSNKILNPMEILCPFEMDGLCRDKDCAYNHCS